jgi:phospho-N-acetylmuramoyl-pentapeptide-transferase
MKFGQQIREEGPQSHLKKQGTPTMGGIFILLGALVAFLKFSVQSMEFWVLIVSLVGFGLVGFLDDYLKVALKRSMGLTAPQKLIGQLLFSGVIIWLLVKMGHSTAITVPGTDWTWEMGWLYYPFIIIAYLGMTNAVNFTDGLDGLLGGTGAIALGAYGILAIYMNMQTEAVFAVALVGALLGFLVYNAPPAKVFMGDVGSLGIGGALVGVAILTKTELLMIVIGFLFVIEMLTVVIQVTSFKLTGKRVFKMTPIHHHFELSGWGEWKIVTIFWTLSLVFAVGGLFLGVNG